MNRRLGIAAISAPEYAETSSITYDASGRGEAEIYERDQDADGDLDTLLTNRWFYDASGGLRSVESLQEYDIDANGVMDHHFLQVGTYDADTRVLSEVQSQDWDGYAGYETVVRSAYTYGLRQPSARGDRVGYWR